MSAPRRRAEAPPVVTALVGMVVALVSVVFGVSAHGLAAGTGAVLPPVGQLLMVAAAGSGVGAVSATLARRRSPVMIAGAGLVVGQGIVHAVLSAGHGSHGAHPLTAPGAAGSAVRAAGGQATTAHHAVDAAAVRAAMDHAALDGAGSVEALLTPGMLGAHLAAIVATVALVAVLSATLAWVAARLLPSSPAAGHLVVVEPPRVTSRTRVPEARYLISCGGTRAPPVCV